MHVKNARSVSKNLDSLNNGPESVRTFKFESAFESRNSEYPQGPGRRGLRISFKRLKPHEILFCIVYL